MPLFSRSSSNTPIPLLNSASPWASTKEDLQQLWGCPHTQAITTRTATLEGYPDDPRKHQVAFFGSKSSINSYGFAPYPLGKYLEWLREIVKEEPRKKNLIVSIGASGEEELEKIFPMLEAFAGDLGIKVGVEFNASCPNLNGSPPPAYSPAILQSYLTCFARQNSQNLQFGIKLPPYTYEEQIVSVFKVIEEFSSQFPDAVEVVSFLTSTNTLGQGLVFADQIAEPTLPSSIAQSSKLNEEFGVPSGYGGLAGESIHQISLGNVHRLRTLLNSSLDPRVKGITLIGVGGASDGASVERFTRAGADAVAIATALGREGIEVFEKIRRERNEL
ncbi:hypothetical protein JCM5353_008233 [Sporobolomyces roseus]